MNHHALFAAIESRRCVCSAEGSRLGVLLVRLQRRRELNILFGYGARERLEAAAGRQLRDALRPVDTVLPLGAGEFVVLLPGLLGANHALLAAHRLLRAFEQPLQTDEGRMQAAIAIGAAVFPDHGEAPDLLCRRAEAAYAQALKSSPRVALFAARDQHAEVPYAELRDALIEGQLEVHLQPIVDVRSGHTVAVESLARWDSPRWGWVNPELFVQLAEQTGLIAEFTRWSVNTTLRHASTAGLAAHGIAVTINLSPRLFVETGIAEQILAALRIWDVPPASVVLEVTENAIMEDPQRSAAVLTQLHAVGVRIAVDDFGVGRSSFAYLRQFPVSELKIDRSFVEDLQRDERGIRLVRSMIGLAHHLGMQVVAEGVADADTLALLTDMDCDRVQGFHVGRPVPAALFADSLPPFAGAAVTDPA